MIKCGLLGGGMERDFEDGVGWCGVWMGRFGCLGV